MHQVVRLRVNRKGTKKADDTALKQYTFRRSYNARIIEEGTGLFPGVATAVDAAEKAHLSDLMDYTGKMVEFEELDYVEETAFPDVLWSIIVDGQAAIGDTSLRAGYVTGDDVQELVTELAECDVNDHSNRRVLRSLIERCQRLIARQKLQAQDE